MAKFLQKSPKTNYHLISSDGDSVCRRAKFGRGYQYVEVEANKSLWVKLCDSCFAECLFIVPGTRQAAIDATVRVWEYKDKKLPFKEWFTKMIEIFPEREQWNPVDWALIEFYAFEEWRERTSYAGELVKEG